MPSSTEYNAAAPVVELREVLSIVNSVYGTSQALNSGGQQECLPLQQQLVICSLLLMMDHATKKLDITVGKVINVLSEECFKFL